jgi:hypothetical protein
MTHPVTALLSGLAGSGSYSRKPGGIGSRITRVSIMFPLMDMSLSSPCCRDGEKCYVRRELGRFGLGTDSRPSHKGEARPHRPPILPPTAPEAPPSAVSGPAQKALIAYLWLSPPSPRESLEHFGILQDRGPIARQRRSSGKQEGYSLWKLRCYL